MRRLPLALLTGIAVLYLAPIAAAALISGTVRSADGNKLVVAATTGRTQTFNVPESATVTLDGRRAALADLQEGHRVSVYTNDAGSVTQVRARSAAAAAPVGSPVPERRPDASATPASREPVSSASTGEWSQYGGPERDNRSPDTGLLKSWPSGGPPLLYTATGLGSGYSSVALSDGKVLTMGGRGDDECVIALDLETGEEVWATRVGTTRPDGTGPGPRGTPTIDGERVYALGANGDLACLELSNGTVVWSGNILREFGGNNITWGISESVLIDGDRVICTPGGKRATMAALDKATGRTVWTSKAPGDPPAAYSSAIAVEAGGARQYVNFTHSGVIGVRANNGDFLWNNSASANGTANCSSPLFYKGHVFSASGYGTGGALVKLTGGRGRGGAELVYKTNEMVNHHGGMVIVGDYLYGADDGSLRCLDVMTGKLQWRDRSVGKGSIVYADGHVILRSEQGPVALVEATPEGYREQGRFDQPNRSNYNSWSHPVVAEGRLFLRDQDKLLVYDLRE